MTINSDNEDYHCFTGPQRLDKELNSIGGLLRGISIDGTVSTDEIEAVRNWIRRNSEFQNRHPFNEIIPALNAALSDSFLDDEEISDILWLCETLTKGDRYFCAATSDMQSLHAITAGILADGIITKEELRGLSDWMKDHEHLKSCWPYDEIEAVVSEVLRDGVVTKEEQKTLIAFFAEFLKDRYHKAIDIPENWGKSNIKGVCAMAPDITFPERLFCFTGKSERATKEQLHALVGDRGGNFSKRLVNSTDYLIIGADGNSCWAFACYGRKVEQAVESRKKGSKLLIVHEYDFWDAIEDS